MRTRKEQYCRYGVHHLKREFAGEDAREFREHFYVCTRCPFQGIARSVPQPLERPSLMTRLFGRVDY
jgi:hypothetical protein